jgi:hypothetical protein
VIAPIHRSTSAPAQPAALPLIFQCPLRALFALLLHDDPARREGFPLSMIRRKLAAPIAISGQPPLTDFGRQNLAVFHHAEAFIGQKRLERSRIGADGRRRFGFNVVENIALDTDATPRGIRERKCRNVDAAQAVAYHQNQFEVERQR